MLMGGAFVTFMMLVLALGLVPMGFWIYSLIEVGRAPDAAFGPPWDNSKSMWLLGLAISAVIPVGIIVTAIVWWSQGHAALRAGQPVPRPFWAPRPSYPHLPPQPPYPPQAQPPAPPEG